MKELNLNEIEQVNGAGWFVPIIRAVFVAATGAAGAYQFGRSVGGLITSNKEN